MILSSYERKFLSMAEKMKFADLTLEYMVDYIENKVKFKDEAEKAEVKKGFKKAAYTSKNKSVEKETVYEKDAEGNYIYIQVKDKNGDPKLDKYGKPLMRRKSKRVNKENGAEKERFNLVGAKVYFCKKFMPDLLENKVKKSDLIKDW